MAATTSDTNDTTSPSLAPPSDDKFSSLAVFASALKTYEIVPNIGNKNETHNVITFNKDLFIATCTPSSSEYKQHLCINYDELAGEIFKEGEVWKDRQSVDDVISLIAKRQGWTSKKDKKTIKCNRFGVSKTTRNFTQGELQSGCTWVVNLKPLVTTTKVYHNTKGTPKNHYVPAWDEPVVIAKGTCTTHGGTCKPSAQNKFATSQRSGDYVKKTPIYAVYSLCNLYEHSGKLQPAIIKAVLEPVLPKQKLITKYDIFDWRARIEKLMTTYRKSNGEYEAFKEVANASGMLDGIDNEVSLNDDEAYTLAHNLWLEVENDTKTKGEALFSFIEYLELIKSRAKGFTYKLAENQDGGKKKKLCGVLWMTATMRKNFELFGDYLCFDMMKRGLNTLLWPYCAVTMFNEMNKICIACEGILCGEREDMYSFTATFLKEKAPGRPLSSVNIVSADGFFDQNMVIELGFINAIFFTDQWHFLDSGLRKKFGKSGYDLLKGHLTGMVKAASEEDFNANLQGARELIANQPQVNGQLEEDLEELASLKNTYASYCHAQVPGNRGHHGNAISESNHSAVLSHLNDGDKNGNNFCEHPIVLIRELLKRQQKNMTQTNQLLFGYTTKMNTEKARLEGEPATRENIELLKAVHILNKPAYERFKARLDRAKLYRLDPSFLDPSTQETCHAVFSLQYPEAAPRLFANADSRCKCNECLQHEDMCTHEILEKGGFQESLFLPKHMARESVEGSLVGWVEEDTAAAQSSIDDMLGFELENLPNVGIDVGIGSADGDMMMVDASATMPSVMPTLPPPPPPGYVPERGAKVKPLPVKRVQRVLSNVAGAYSSCGEERKFELCDLVLKLEKLMLQESTQSQIVENENIVMDVPSNASRACQAKKRLKSTQEVQSKKYKKELQRQGVAQVVDINARCSLVVNAKSKNHCSFCDSTAHKVTNCDKKQEMIGIGNEYVLTTEQPGGESDLRARIMIMPQCTDGGGKGGISVFGELANTYQNNNFIIHNASLVMGDKLGDIQSMIFCISIIGKMGIVLDGPSTNKIWVKGSVMNTLITHKNKRKKYVYDGTSRSGVKVAV